MNDFLDFLTSKEIIVVYIVTFAACLLCFIIYIIEKYSEKSRRKHNTRELNKLVSQLHDEGVDTSVSVLDKEPEIVEVLDDTVPLESNILSIDKEDNDGSIFDISNDNDSQEEELQYTSIEPDQVTARLELEKLKEELRRQEELERQEELKNEEELKREEIIENNNIALTDYEEEQEESAIISLEELVKKSKSLYESNELSQYVDEGVVPISLQELEKSSGKESTSYNTPFVISDVVGDDVLDAPVKNNDLVTMKDFSNNMVSSKFKSSPIISPIYGIERPKTDLELENTANYEKLDDEIRRTNEFLMTLRELQKKLDK